MTTLFFFFNFRKTLQFNNVGFQIFNFISKCIDTEYFNILIFFSQRTYLLSVFINIFQSFLKISSTRIIINLFRRLDRISFIFTQQCRGPVTVGTRVAFCRIVPDAIFTVITLSAPDIIVADV